MTAQTSLRTLPSIDLEFPAGLPGLPDARRFRLEPLGGELNVFGRLVASEPIQIPGSDEAHEMGFVVAAPGLLWPDYRVEVPDDVAELLGLEDPASAIALVIVNLAEEIGDSTANLYAPLVVNSERRVAVQVVPDGPEEGVPPALRVPLPLPAVPC